LQKAEELKKLREDLVSLHQAKTALEAKVREMELNQEQNSNVLTEHEAEFQKETTRWFAEKEKFPERQRKGSFRGNFSQRFPSEQHCDTPSFAICSYVERTLIWQLQVRQLQHHLDMAVRLHKLEKEETEYHHLILVQENGDLLRETAAALEGVTRLEDLLQRSKSEQKTMLEQMESLRVELKMHKDTILPSQHQRMLELVSRMHRLQECAATARSNDLMRQLQRKVIGYWESYNMSRQINTRT